MISARHLRTRRQADQDQRYPALSLCLALRSGRGRFLLVQRTGHLRFLASREIGMDDVPGRCLVELLGREAEFLAEFFYGAIRGRQELLELRLDRLLDGAIVQAPFRILSEPFLVTAG